MTQVTTDSIERKSREVNSREKEKLEKWNAIKSVLAVISSKISEVITRWKPNHEIASIDLGEYVLSVVRTKYRGEISGVSWCCTDSDISCPINYEKFAIPSLETVRDLYSKLPIIIKTVDKAENCADLGISSYFA